MDMGIANNSVLKFAAATNAMNTKKETDMKIQTRFDIGDKVLFLTEKQLAPKTGIIHSIHMHINKEETEIRYNIKDLNSKRFFPDFNNVVESRVFVSKDDFVNFTLNLTSSL